MKKISCFLTYLFEGLQQRKKNKNEIEKHKVTVA